MHIDRLEVQLAQERAIAKRKLSEATTDLRANKQQYSKYQDFQLEHPDDYEKHHKGKLELYEQRANAANHSIKELEAELKRLEQGLPTEEEFYELIHSYLETMVFTDDLLATDIICNELVTNLRAGNDCVPVIKLNPPYNLMVDLPEISNGRGERT